MLGEVGEDCIRRTTLVLKSRMLLTSCDLPQADYTPPTFFYSLVNGNGGPCLIRIK